MNDTTMSGTKELTFFEATSVIAGYGIGGGILAVPYLVSLNGLWTALAIIAAAYAASLVLHLMIAELCAGDGSGSQIVELYRKYLFTGKGGGAFTWVFFGAMGLMFLANLAAYVAGGNETLAQALGVPAPWGALLFYVAAAVIAAFGLKVLGVAEKWAVIAMALLFVALTAATIVIRASAGSPAAAWTDAATAVPASIRLPLALYGMLMFCFASFFAVPQTVVGLASRPRLVPKAVAAGLGVNCLLILLVTAMSLIASDKVTEIATIGWARALGPWAEAAGAAFVLLAMLTSYWSISFALSTMIRERVGIGNVPAWLISTLPSLVLAVVGLGGFLDFMRTAGGGIALLVALLFVPTYWRYRKTVDTVAVLPRALDKRAWGWAIVAAYALMAVGSLVPIR
jgi:amino acid permease